MIGKKLMVMLFSMLIVVTIFSEPILSYTIEEKNDRQSYTRPGYGGMIIGRVKSLNRFHSSKSITCQAVNVYYDIVWLPPYYTYEESGWLNSGEIKIFRPYIGIVLPHFIFIFLTDFYIPI